MKFKTLLLFLFFLFVLGDKVYSAEDATLYATAIKQAKAGNSDFAFMQYRSILIGFPNSKYREYALFATGEYYFSFPKYEEAKNAFTTLVTDYPNFKGKLFAMAYLFKMAELKKDMAFKEKIRKEIINLQQVSLIFRKSKEYKYHSPMNRTFKAIFYIDMIEFYSEGELFARIFY